MVVVPLSNQGGKGPEGQLETLAVEMLGVAPGLLASPGGPRVFFCFLLFQVRHIAIKRENKQRMFPWHLFHFK